LEVWGILTEKHEGMKYMKRQKPPEKGIESVSFMYFMISCLHVKKGLLRLTFF